MFERFTSQARAAIVAAQAESREMHHSYIGVEHILLGLLREHDNQAAAYLRSSGISAEQVRERVLELVGPGERSWGPDEQVPFTPGSKKVLELAMRESLESGQPEIGAELLLVGIARDDESVSMRILEQAGLSSKQIRDAMLEGLPAPPSQRLRRLGVGLGGIRVTPSFEVSVAPSEQVRRALMAAGARALDDGRTEIELTDLLAAIERLERAEEPPEASAG